MTTDSQCTLVGLAVIDIRQWNLFLVDNHHAGRRFWEANGWSEWPSIRFLSKRLGEDAE